MEVTTERREPRWGLGDVVVGIVVAQVASTVLAVTWLAVRGNDEMGLDALAIGQVGLWAGLFGAPLLAARKGSGSLKLEFGLEAIPVDAMGGLVGAVMQLAVVPVMYLLIQVFTGELDVGQPARELAARANGPAFIVLAMLVSLVAPLVEELFYRGLFLRAATRRWGTAWGVLVSSAVFGASHFQPVQFPGLFAFGVVLAVLALRTNRLGASIAAHVVFNAVTMIILAAT